MKGRAPADLLPQVRRYLSHVIGLVDDLLAAERPDEASAEALSAVTSRLIVPSN